MQATDGNTSLFSHRPTTALHDNEQDGGAPRLNPKASHVTVIQKLKSLRQVIMCCKHMRVQGAIKIVHLFLLLSLRYKWHIYLSSNNAFTVFCS
jgi:hypothetical protein